MAAKLGQYEVNINGIRHEMQLTAEDAERIGASLVKKSAPATVEPEAAKAAVAPANKAGVKPADK